MEPVIIELESMRLLCLKWEDIQQLALRMAAPSDDLLPIDNHIPLVKCQTRASGPGPEQTSAAYNAVYARYCEPVLKVRKTGKNTTGYRQFNSSGRDQNPVFDPVLTFDEVPHDPVS